MGLPSSSPSFPQREWGAISSRFDPRCQRWRRASLGWEIDSARAEPRRPAFLGTRGRNRHRRCRLHGHAGATHGEARARRVLPRRGGGARAEGCNYLLALDMEMDPVAGLRAGELGARLRRLLAAAGPPDAAAHPLACRRPRSSSATCVWHDGSPVEPSPARCCARRSSGRGRAGLEAMFGTELEFYVLKESYAEAHAKRYRGLTPSVPYILDYHVLAGHLRRAAHPPDPERHGRRRHPGGELQGRGWPGQHEINFRFADALDDGRRPRDLQERRQGDRAPERLLDHLHGQAGSRVDRQLLPHARRALDAEGPERVCDGDDEASSAASSPADRLRPRAPSSSRPTINSYKRYAGRELGADDARLGARQPHVRLPRRRPRRRQAGRETRMPGGDVNPYLAFAAMLAAGLHGIEQELEPPPALEGNAYESDAERFPRDAREAIEALEQGTIARAALGDSSSTTTSTTPARSSGSSTRRSPATSASGCSSAVERSRRPVVGITSYASVEARFGRLDGAVGAAPRLVRPAGRARGRTAADRAPVRATTTPRSARAARRPHRLRRPRPRPGLYGVERAPRDGRRRGPSAIASSSALLRARSSGTCRCWPSAVASQVLNVARGGDLVQHLPDVLGHERAQAHARPVRRPRGARRPQQPPRPRPRRAHAPVKSHHHQGYGRLGEGCAPWPGPTTGPSRRSRIRAGGSPRRALASRRKGRTCALPGARRARRAAIARNDARDTRCREPGAAYCRFVSPTRAVSGRSERGRSQRYPRPVPPPPGPASASSASTGGSAPAGWPGRTRPDAARWRGRSSSPACCSTSSACATRARGRSAA